MKDTFRIFLGDCNSPLLVIDKTTREKISKFVKDLNIINQFHPIAISRTICTVTAEYTFFSHTYEILTNKVHILGHKTSVRRKNY